MLFVSLSIVLACAYTAFGAKSRTKPPHGAIVVRAGTSNSREYPSVQAAVNSLPDNGSKQVIFIYPGTYTEQVYINRTGPLTIYGYTKDTSSYSGNQAIIAFNMGIDLAGSNDASGTLRIHKDDFNMYNIHVKNTRGAGVQAPALSEYGSRVGFYGCGFYGYQDTLYANNGTQVYLKGYIEASQKSKGKIDFIYGRLGSAYFGGNTIAVSGPGYITASGRQSDDWRSYVFENNTIVQTADAEPGTSGGFYFGRPWAVYAKVIFKNTTLQVAPNPALWSLWVDDPNSVSNAFLADYNTSGVGADSLSRASFAKQLSDDEAGSYSISSAVGADYKDWVDTSYL